MMGKRILALAPGLAALAWVLSATVAAGDPPGHLVPFPEDAQGERAEPKPARPQPPKSNFQPRFRVPQVQQAAHLEPAEADGEEQPAETDAVAAPRRLAEAVADEEPQPVEAAEEPTPAANRATGREALGEAYAKSKDAAGEDDYTEIIALCKTAQAGGLSEKYDAYSRQLTGWALNRRGEVRAKAGQDAEALADFEAAVAAGGAWRAIHNRGVSYAGAGRLEEAMADLNRAIQLNPRYPHAYFNRGELRYQQDDLPGAIEDFTLAIRLGTREAAVYAGRAHAYYKMQRFGDALRDYGEAIKLDPEDADALVNRGDTYSDLGKYGEAAKDYRAAVRLAPTSSRAFQAAAWLMATCPDMHYRDEKLAIDAARRAIELGGASFRNLSTLAAAQAGAGMFAEAEETQEQAIAAASQEEVVTAEKMMSLYRRKIAYRDRPLTAFKTPEERVDEGVQPASAEEPSRAKRPVPQASRAWYQELQDEPTPVPRAGRRWPWQGPSSQQPPPSRPAGRPPKARLFAPRGRI